MATGLDNLWIYKLAEDLSARGGSASGGEIKVHEITKNFSKLNGLQNQKPTKL